MSISSLAVETVRLQPTGGCGSLESPWTGWEDQLEAGARSDAKVWILSPGFYGVSRPIRLASGTTLAADPAVDGRAWFLPAPTCQARLETLFLVDGHHEITLTGICLNGREHRAAHGLLVRCGTAVQVVGCRFGDFADESGAAILVSGESEDRHVRSVVVKDCHILNGAVGLRLGRDATDLLVTGNRFEEIAGPSLLLDPKDHWSSYGLIFVKNRAFATRPDRPAPFVHVMPGAEGIRIAENTFEGPTSDGSEWSAVEVHGGGPMSTRRIEVLLNMIVGVPGPGIVARQCGPGFLAAGNRITACGSGDDGSIQLTACHGILVEDNEIDEPAGPGIRASDCRATRLNGNGVLGHSDRAMPRAGDIGIRIDGEGSRRLRITDNKISGMKEAGIRVDDSAGVRIVGNEVEDCGEGIRAAKARGLLLVGNDCRDNSDGGLLVDREVTRGWWR